MSSTPRESSWIKPPPAEAGEDWWAMGDLFSMTVDRASTPIEGIHRAIARRWFGFAGASADRASHSYDVVTKSIYVSVRAVASAIGAVVPFGAAAIRRRHSSSPIRDSPVRSGLRSTANALWGDDLERRNSRLAIEMGFRNSDGGRCDLASALPARTRGKAGGRLVVLIHGLGETERCWQPRSDTTLPLAELLTSDSFDPVFVRYNTGRHISSNGADLARLLDESMTACPIEITDIALIGHSMGGLVARSALDAGLAAGHRWAACTHHIVTLGTPHLGSPIEKGANFLAWGLGFAPESRPLGDFIQQRSAGIKDLRFGATRREDWDDVDPETLLADAVGDVAPPEGVAQHFVAGVVTESSAHPVGALIGDMIVRVGSATGRGRRRRVEATDVFVLGRQHHFALATDPAVHEQIRAWLST